MIGRILLKALFNLRNITVLVVLLAVGAMNLDKVPFGWNSVLAASFGVYAILVTQSLFSKKFHESVSFNEKTREIKELNNKCMSLSYEAKKCLTSSYYKRLRKVMDDKNEIVKSYLEGEQGYLKEKIVVQTLNLVMSYLKLLANFSKRSKEVASINTTDIANRVRANTFKLSSNIDQAAAEDIRKSIEMDEKVVARFKDEKQELERISAKLDYMESMVNMFKQQIISSIESEDMLEKLESAVNEATALDNVLDERRKKKYSV